MKKPQSLPDRPENLEQLIAVTNAKVSELIQDQRIEPVKASFGDRVRGVQPTYDLTSIHESDKKSVCTLYNLTVIVPQLLDGYAKSKSLETFIGRNALLLNDLRQTMDSFDAKTWAPKVESDVQSKVATVFRDFVYDVRGMRSKVFPEQKLKELTEPPKSGGDSVMGGLLKIAVIAGDRTKAYESAKVVAVAPPAPK